MYSVITKWTFPPNMYQVQIESFLLLHRVMFFNKLIRRFVIQRALGSNFVPFCPPDLDKLLGMLEVQKPVFVETFIPKFAIETFDESIIHRFPGFNVIDINPTLLGPLLKGLPRKFRSVVHANVAGITYISLPVGVKRCSLCGLE